MEGQYHLGKEALLRLAGTSERLGEGGREGGAGGRAGYQVQHHGQRSAAPERTQRAADPSPPQLWSPFVSSRLTLATRGMDAVGFSNVFFLLFLLSPYSLESLNKE